MRLRYFAATKSGGGMGEYEDAVWPETPDAVLAADRLRFAVADGASESLLAGSWARLLARTACGYDPRSLRRAVRRAAQAWPEQQAAWLAGRTPPWWQLEKLERGAHATVLVLQLDAAGPGRPAYAGSWRAAAVGDGCLLQLREGKLVRSFPIESPAAFTIRPDLVSSVAPRACRPSHAVGDWAPGDRLLLVTDALAAWLLAADTAARADLLAELERAGATAFADWADEFRARRAVRDDDLTLLLLDL